MIVALSLSFFLNALLLQLGMAKRDTPGAWPRLYTVRAAGLRQSIFGFAVNSSGTLAAGLNMLLLLFATWFLACIFFAGAHMLGGLLGMPIYAPSTPAIGCVFIVLVGLFILSIFIVLIFGLLLHATLFPLAFAVVWARRGHRERSLVKWLSAAFVVAGALSLTAEWR